MTALGQQPPVPHSSGPGSSTIRRLIRRLRRGSKDLFAADAATPRPRPNSDAAAVALELWNAGYNALCDNPASAGLVFVYESIIAQELPADLDASVCGRSDAERLDMLAAITAAALRKRRASRAGQSERHGQAGCVVRAVLDAAIAWSGLCTLTPLLLDPIIQRADVGAGVDHVVGRIPWYMALAQLLDHRAWPAALVDLFRAVLKLEMNCVCAAASAWNTAAKNVVGWAELGALARQIARADADLPAIRERLLPLDLDLVLPLPPSPSPSAESRPRPPN